LGRSKEIWQVVEYRKGHKVDPSTGLTKPEERAGLTREEAEARARADGQAQAQEEAEAHARAEAQAQRTADTPSPPLEPTPRTPAGTMAQLQLDESVAGDEYERLKKKVKQGLEANVSPDEVIRVIVPGAHGQAIIGTDTRAFVCKPGFMTGASFGPEVTSWSYQNLLGVQLHKGMMTGSVVLQGPGQSGKKSSYWGGKDDDPAKAPNAIPVAGNWNTVNERVARLRQLIDEAHSGGGSGSSGAAASGVSTADELRKLADLHTEGLLTKEEFEAAKAKILGA
jgi:hypothetical protein